MKKKAKITITAGGKEYPCEPSMGMMLRFRKETGKEITEMDPSSFSELCAYLWCYVISACNIEGVPFNYSLLDFADRVSPEDMRTWQEVIMSEPSDDADDAEGEGEKKNLPGSLSS